MSNPSVQPWWHPRAHQANLSPVARLIRAEARAARTSDPAGELQRLLTMFRLPAGYQRDQALYELAGLALAALQRTLQRAKRLHEVSESQFLEAVKRAADATWGPIDFVPIRRRIRVRRLDRAAHPAIADHFVTTVPLIAAARSAFVQRVLAELEQEAQRAAPLAGAVAEPVDQADSSMDPA
jgi:hypothetical protein